MSAPTPARSRGCDSSLASSLFTATSVALHVASLPLPTRTNGRGAFGWHQRPFFSFQGGMSDHCRGGDSVGRRLLVDGVRHGADRPPQASLNTCSKALGKMRPASCILHAHGSTSVCRCDHPAIETSFAPVRCHEAGRKSAFGR